MNVVGFEILARTYVPQLFPKLPPSLAPDGRIRLRVTLSSYKYHSPEMTDIPPVGTNSCLCLTVSLHARTQHTHARMEIGIVRVYLWLGKLTALDMTPLG